MKRVKSPLTIELLAQLQEFYDARKREQFFREDGCETSGIERIVFEEYCHLLDLLDEWMQQPTRIEFDARKKRRVRTVRASQDV